MTYTIVVSGQTCTKYDKSRKLAADSIEFVDVVFQLPSEWAGLQCVAQFAQNDKCYNKALVDGKCKLPNEMQAGEFSVSVFGYEAGQVVRGTTIPLVDVIEKSGFRSDGATPVPPTPDLYAQLLEKVNQTEATTGKYADAAKQSADAARASEDRAANSAADADRTANSIKDSMAQISENKEAVSKLKEDLADKVPKSDYAPEAKTDAMTQPVGKDADGKLWTAPGSGGGGGTWSEITDKPFNTIDGNTLINRSGALCVNTTDDAEQDNTRPITSSGVHVICGNINALLHAI